MWGADADVGHFQNQYVLGSNSHHFHIIGDGHQPNSRGLYTNYYIYIYKDSLLNIILYC